MSKSYSKARVSLTQREMRERAQRREFKTRNATSDSVELLDRRFDYEQRDIYEMLNMRHDAHYHE
ncbi:hypothetical protein HJA82_28890 [Rhizobium bangladeshense]|uniref:hypothetical protein n=1 Tax=Rhizobium bangladeshense TaxID=1138189 RepID=UPI001C838DAF|nr:hypothetical protein [Rhizobium bangladeshense]MBX4911330.1 hypothetical protein [Rhizobium bangladeshense]